MFFFFSVAALSRQRISALRTTCLSAPCLFPSHNQQLFNRNFSTEPPNDSTTKIDAFRQREEQRDQQDEANTDTHQTTDADKTARIAAIRESILNAALPFVAQYGWSRDAIAHGATTINYPGIVHGLFPGGGIELIQHFALVCDRQLIEQLRARLPLKPTSSIDGVDVLLPQFAFVADAIRARLEMLEPMREHWSQALAIRAMPANAPGAIEQTLRMVDDICYLAGDRSADVSGTPYLVYLLLFAFFSMWEYFFVDSDYIYMFQANLVELNTY